MIGLYLLEDKYLVVNLQYFPMLPAHTCINSNKFLFLFLSFFFQKSSYKICSVEFLNYFCDIRDIHVHFLGPKSE